MMRCPYCKGTGKVEASFAARLRALREDKGLTQLQLSAIADVSRPQLANLEAGRSEPSIRLLTTLSTELEVSTDWLLGRSDEP